MGGRLRLARNTDCDPDLLTLFLTDQYEDVRQQAISNPNLPSADLKRVVSDVMAGLDGRTGLSRVLTLEADAIIWNPAVTVDSLDLLMVACVAHTEAVADPNAVTVMTAILHSARCSPAWLEWASRAPQVGFRIAAAGNPTIRVGVAEVLVWDPNFLVTSSLIRNDAIPESVLCALAPVAEEPILVPLVDRLTGDSKQVAVDRLMGIGSTVLARLTVAEHTTNSSHVTQLCVDSDVLVRTAAGLNPVATVEDRIMVALLAATSS